MYESEISLGLSILRNTNWFLFSSGWVYFYGFFVFALLHLFIEGGGGRVVKKLSHLASFLDDLIMCFGFVSLLYFSWGYTEVLAAV